MELHITMTTTGNSLEDGNAPIFVDKAGELDSEGTLHCDAECWTQPSWRVLSFEHSLVF